MFIHTDVQPHLIFLVILLTLSWSFATWLTMQSKKRFCELLPQIIWLSKHGLLIGTFLMIINLWFLSLFYEDLKLSMTIIFVSIIIGIGSYLAKYFEWLVFVQDVKEGFWKSKLNVYFKNNYGNGLGPLSTQKILQSMIPNWWVQLLPNHYQLEIEEAMEIITERSHDYALRRGKMN
tara:strand:- start:230 stop:760 length:531 start_codon:yes stop_codon:yes gene_type:complete